MRPAFTAMTSLALVCAASAVARAESPAAAEPAEQPSGTVLISPPPAQPETPPPPPEPAPVAPAPPAAPVLGPPTPPPRAIQEPRRASPPPSETPWRNPHEFGLELGLGVNGRFGNAAGYDRDRGLGPNYALGFWYRAANPVLLGLELTHTRLGHGDTQSGQSLVSSDFSESAAWLGTRVLPWRSPSVHLFLALRVGLAVEHVSATGVRQLASMLESPTAFDCSGTHGPAFALAAGAGAVFPLNARIELVTRADAHVEQLTSEPIGACAAGLGSATSVGAGLAVNFAFDSGATRDGASEFGGSRARAHTW